VEIPAKYSRAGGTGVEGTGIGEQIRGGNEHENEAGVLL
jgi:hypothetical protein